MENWGKERNVFAPTKILNTRSFIQISAGQQFSLALDSFGCIWSFGMGDDGRLGLGDERSRVIPTKIKDLPHIKSICAGATHGIALDHSGSVWSFGNNGHGQLGLGDLSNRLVPCKIEKIPSIAQVSAGCVHNLMLDSLGKVWSCGDNRFGQLGLGDYDNRWSPTLIKFFAKTENENPETLGYFNSVLGYVWSVWPFGGGSDSDITVEDIIEVIAAGKSSIIKNDQQQVFVFGANQYSQLELKTTARAIPSPVEQENWRNKTIIPGGEHNLIVDEVGNLFFFGRLHDLPVKVGKQEDIIIYRKPLLMKRARENSSESESL